MIESILQRILHLIESIGYLGVGIGMFLENVFPPIPSEALIPFSGFLAAEGKLNLILVILIGTIGSYFGTLPFYILGYFGHRKKVIEFVEKYGKYLAISPEKLDETYDMFKKYGYGLVFFGRLIPLVRSVISFPAGSVRMNFLLYSIYTFLGSLIRTSILAILGYILGKNRELVGGRMKTYEHIMLPIVGVVILGIAIRFFRPKKSK